ncbi:DUF4440 domain-containing protein [Cryobacterium zongtaii]|uniref:DUF4440 domain-containing protein n=1 Tax=Cryobacterium zongtaii TaxID=1259217 RepID=A0A2S3ZBZ7_9MICO|nr:nuclear transport factor 2 family protein [Cryobacterium zongtaii]POH63000.1 DUF4440 domain-containing protein [Cryobacterium zongtaii]
MSLSNPATEDIIRSTEDIIRSIEEARLRALVAGDVEAARVHHATDFQLITPIGVALSRDEYLGAIASGQINYLSWEAGPIVVRLHGDTASIRYAATLEVVFIEQHVPKSRYWHTDTYEYLDDRWQIVWSQATQVR